MWLDGPDHRRLMAGADLTFHFDMIFIFAFRGRKFGFATNFGSTQTRLLKYVKSLMKAKCDANWTHKIPKILMFRKICLIVRRTAEVTNRLVNGWEPNSKILLIWDFYPRISWLEIFCWYFGNSPWVNLLLSKNTLLWTMQNIFLNQIFSITLKTFSDVLVWPVYLWLEKAYCISSFDISQYLFGRMV